MDINAIPGHNANVERIFSLVAAQWTKERYVHVHDFGNQLTVKLGRKCKEKARSAKKSTYKPCVPALQYFTLHTRNIFLSMYSKSKAKGLIDL